MGDKPLNKTFLISGLMKKQKHKKNNAPGLAVLLDFTWIGPICLNKCLPKTFLGNLIELDGGDEADNRQ